jgi:hypothetical protein
MCSNGMDELAATNCYTLDLMLSMAMAFRRVEESFGEYCRGRDDSAPDAAITGTRLSTTCAADTMELSSYEQHQVVSNRKNLNRVMVRWMPWFYEHFRESHIHGNLTFSLSAMAVKQLPVVICLTCHVYGVSIFCPTKPSCVLTCNSLEFTFWT